MADVAVKMGEVALEEFFHRRFFRDLVLPDRQLIFNSFQFVPGSAFVSHLQRITILLVASPKVDVPRVSAFIDAGHVESPASPEHWGMSHFTRELDIKPDIRSGSGIVEKRAAWNRRVDAVSIKCPQNGFRPKNKRLRRTCK